MPTHEETQLKRQASINARPTQTATRPPRTDVPDTASSFLAVVRAVSADTPNTILVQDVAISRPDVEGDPLIFTPEVDDEGAAVTFTLDIYPFTLFQEWKKFVYLPDTLALGVMLIPYMRFGGGILLPLQHLLWDEYLVSPNHAIDDCLPPTPNAELDG